MALIARVIVDTSAAARMTHERVAARVRPLIESGVVATCPTLDAEALYSSRSAAEYRQVRQRRRRVYEYLPIEDRHWQAAFDAQADLAASGRHRAVGIVDLLTAVLAARHGLTVVHYDADFEIAAEVIEFSHRWVAPRGSIP